MSAHSSSSNSSNSSSDKKLYAIDEIALLKVISEPQTNANSNAEVLVVDDNAMNSIAVGSLLVQFNYLSDYARDGYEAIDAIKERLRSGK